ncbi:helix-turn-helix domain-containing protein [Vibrio mangrovi]|uniref:Helix-turn-helix domain protein n=1 Tax=Vibrio mangrovi TaxID=474394 RepID=A0A1Y6IWC2_9VIBR|nr:helix-turn-helix transcriptional regulator [Vibrio mangrovi]MDW6002515.1 helix-turn-helix transcriptional regulator [Vibrio mangrovi]SMS01954.1 Helix-turn-helix domain protein [Vibrio mangrovi]
MEHVGERLREVMLMRGVNASKMAKELSLSKGHISNIITGRIQTPKKHLPSIATYLKVSYAWLLTGKGGPEEEAEQAVFPVYDAALPELQCIAGHCTLPTGICITDEHFGMVSIPSFPPGVLVLIAPKKQGDGFYLVQGKRGPVLAQRIDRVTHLEWLSLENMTLSQPSVLGKIEAILAQEMYEYEKA